ncbi:MAG: RluA family pseudouridine synthase [Myxococcales bacterium]|nr:RluA family pseudouridine synthase [Myxococcales bacterium]
MTRLRHVTDRGFLRPDDTPEGSVVSAFRVPPEMAGRRLDVFLQGELRRTSRTRAQFIVRASAYDERGKRLRPNYRVKSGELVLLWRAPWDEEPVPTEIPVVYEDEHLLAIDKPALLPVHPTARYHRNTVIRLLKDARPGAFLSLGHRIDRETSGVLLLAKSPECDRSLKMQLEAREGVDKGYLAIAWGEPDPARADAQSGVATPCVTDDGREGFRYARSLELDPEHGTGVKMRLGRSERALAAATRFTVLERRTRDSRAYTLIRCDLETGRQHQIRIHLASLGAPIVGDKLYGPDEGCFTRGADGELTEDDLELLELPRHALHAARMSLAHPVTGAPLVVEASLPPDLQAFWDDLDRVDAR